MRKVLSIIMLLIAYQTIYANVNELETDSDSQLQICTFNIRGNKAIDGANQWEFRRDSVSKLLTDSKYDVICLQEAIQTQLGDILDRTNFNFVGIRGMYNPILFNSERLELIHTETFWLSETSEPCSVGWDGKYDRYCTWAKFRDRKTSAEFLIFNTHLDHRGELAQREGAKLACERAKSFGKESPVIICGDMNVREDSEAYATFTKYLKDSKSEALKVNGPEGTFHSFGRIEPFRIDYLFVNEAVKVLNYTVNDLKFGNGVLPSDHYPVFIKIKIK